jgi:hypothetical protein
MLSFHYGNLRLNAGNDSIELQLQFGAELPVVVFGVAGMAR